MQPRDQRGKRPNDLFSVDDQLKKAHFSSICEHWYCINHQMDLKWGHLFTLWPQMLFVNANLSMNRVPNIKGPPAACTKAPIATLQGCQQRVFATAPMSLVRCLARGSNPGEPVRWGCTQRLQPNPFACTGMNNPVDISRVPERG